MRQIKLNLIGKNSISSFLFWGLVIYLTFIVYSFTKMLIAPQKLPLVYDVWETFKLNILFALPQLILFPLLLIVLKVLKSSTIFSKKMILHLTIFAIFCFLMPLLKYTLSHLFFNKDIFDGEFYTALYMFLGVISIFSASIFKKGYKIQQENDLTI